jgi:hypothetical protein
MKTFISVLYFLFFIVVCEINYSQPSAMQPSNYTTSDGSNGDPYFITSVNNLYWLTQTHADWDKYYKQTADINLTGSESWDSGSGFDPIGNNSVKFTGGYDGQGYTISNMTISRGSSNYIGLFGYTTNGTISNLKVQSVSIVGQYYVGAISGYNFNTDITNCSSSGNISGSQDVGGLCGREQNSEINTCFSSCDVSGSTVIGGLLSKATGTIIAKCFAFGDVTAVDLAGGFIGWISEASIQDCYSRGDLLRNSGSATQFGGFIGASEDASDISTSYSTGYVSFYPSDPTDKGFIGNDDASNFYTDCFWDVGSSGQTTSAGSTVEIVGKTTGEMKTASTFTSAGWSSDTWNIDAGTNDGYPYLDWQNGGGTPLPVELISFSASQVDDGILLKWQTATEVNNYGFEIERSLVISNEERNLEWEKIGFVTGHGNNNSPKSYEFVDENPPIGNLKYRLKQIDTDGSFTYYNTIAEVNTGITSAELKKLPTEFSLSQNYPNPFNPSTTISYGIPVVDVPSLPGGLSRYAGQTDVVEGPHVSIKVYDILGNEVATLVDQHHYAGTYKVTFNAAVLNSGVYFYKLTAGSFSQLKKMLLLK